MTWNLVDQEAVTPQGVYDILRHHQLLPESMQLSASICNGIAGGGSHFLMADEESGETIGHVFVSGVVHGDSAQVDLVPVAKHFRTGFDEPLSDAMSPLLELLFGKLEVRRVTSTIPASRSRTKRALCSLGFVPEGRVRCGVVLHNKEPEDLRVLGLLREDFYKET